MGRYNVNAARAQRLEAHGERLIHTERGLGYVLRTPA